MNNEFKDQFGHFLNANNEQQIENFVSENYNKKMFKLAFYDSLTNLPKRNYFKLKSEEMMNKNTTGVAVLFFDIDDLKKINNNFGYILGDKWLKTIILEINKILNPHEQLFKWGGDEFIVLVDSTNIECICNKAKLILEICNRSYEVHGKNIQLSASMGVSIYQNHDTPIDEVLKKADIAMNRAKTNGKNCCVFFHKDMQKSIEEKLQLETDLKKAIKSKEFILYYQPLFSLKEFNIIGVEALIRWEHPNIGLIPPIKFIPLAEETGLIKYIGKLVIEEVFKQSRAWEEKGYKNMKISINISDIELRSEDFIKFIRENLKKHRVNPKNIIIEVTETVMMQSIERNIGIFKELQNMGMKIALDDFGTGYSSLSYLKRLPINIIKIDKIFIDNIYNDDMDKAFIDGIINLGHKMNMEIVAEGVELEEQLMILKQSGCDIVQGYFIGKPMEINAIDKILENEVYV